MKEVLETVKKHNRKYFKIAMMNAIKYNAANDERDVCDSEGKDFKRWDKKCAMYFDKYMEAMYMLPIYEQRRIDKLFF
jgi:hypothetical protein